MFPSFSTAWFLCALSILATANGDGSCEKKMRDVKLIPTYADIGTSGDLKVVYEEKFPLQCGNKMSITKTTHPPTITYDLQGKCDNASIIFFDPDAPIPVPEKMHLFLHWFVLNIPADVLKKGYSNEQGGKISAKYFPPLAPTGNHRYTFCIYCQEKYIKHAKCRNTIIERTGVNPRDLADTYHLGNPLSCNFLYLVAVEVDFKGVPLMDKLSDANKKLGNSDDTPV